MSFARDFKELQVYRLAFDAAMAIFAASREWPKEERYSLTDQIRRASRAVCGNVAEAWQKRLYVAHFVSKLSDANAEAAETVVWLDFAQACGYLTAQQHAGLTGQYRHVIGGLIKMIANPQPWCGPAVRETPLGYDVALNTDSLTPNSPD